MLSQKLRARLAPDDALEVAHHLRERVRAHHRADGIEEMDRVFHVLLEGAVHRVLEGARTARHGHQLAAQNFHLGDVGVLLGDVDLAHVDFALDTHQRTGRRQRHPMLASARFGQHLGLAHVLGQQRLAQAVVDFVRPGVVQVFALQVDVRAALAIGQTLGIKNRAGPTHVVRVQICQFFLKGRGLADLFVGDVDIVHHGLELGGKNLPAVLAKVALTVGHFQKLLCHAMSLCVVKKP